MSAITKSIDAVKVNLQDAKKALLQAQSELEIIEFDDVSAEKSVIDHLEISIYRLDREAEKEAKE